MARTKAEIGAPGLPIFAGRLSLETNTRLRWPGAGLIYQQMLNDEPAAAALWTAVRTLLRTDIQVTPGGNTDQDKQAAEHIEACFDDMRDPFATTLRQMASALFYGFNIHEKVFKRRPDGLVGWAAWALRRQASFYQWETNKNGRISAFVQRPAPDYVLRKIWLKDNSRPAGYGWGIHLVADDVDGSPEGRGALRPMYRYWYMVTQFELLGSIALERFGTGMPVFSRTDETNPVKLTPEQENTLADIAAGIRQNEEAYVLEPSGIRFRFEPSPGIDSASYLAFIQNFRIWMLSTALAEFIALGTGDTGSFALGKSKIDLFLKSLTGFQDRLCDTINRQAIPQLMRYNGWGELEEYPKVSLPAVREYDLAALGGFASILSKIGAFHATPADEEWFRKISDLVDIKLEDLEKLHKEAEAQAEEARKAAIAGKQQQDEQEMQDAPTNGKEEENIADMEEVA